METYEEQQRFDQLWLWALLLLMPLAAVATFGTGMFRQLVQGVPWGTRPMPDIALLLVGGGSIAFSVLLLLAFRWMRLKTRVDDEGVKLHFVLLRRRTVPFADIARCEVVDYRPIREYGGWGIRRGRGGWAYNVTGTRGVRLDLTDGSHLLIGSRRPEALQAAIEARRGGPADAR